MLVRDRLTLVLYAALGMLGFLLNGIGAILAPLQEQLGVSRAEVAFYPSLFAVALVVTGLFGGPFVRAIGHRVGLGRGHQRPAGRRAAARLLGADADPDRGCPARPQFGIDHPARPGRARRPASAVHHRHHRQRPTRSAASPAWRRRPPSPSLWVSGSAGRQVICSRCSRWPGACSCCCCCSAGTGSRPPTPPAGRASRPQDPVWLRAGCCPAGSPCCWRSAWSSAWSSGPPTRSPNGMTSAPPPAPALAAMFLLGMAVVRAASLPAHRGAASAGRHAGGLRCCHGRVCRILGIAEHRRCGDRPAGRRRAGVALLYPAALARVISAWPDDRDRAAARGALASGGGDRRCAVPAGSAVRRVRAAGRLPDRSRPTDRADACSPPSR